VSSSKNKNNVMPLAELIAAGAGAAGSIINPILQARENKKNREYNKPINQMARLKEAGLNPHLVYGNGANAQMPSQQAPQVNEQAPMQMLNAYQNYTLQSIEKDKLKEQIELLKLQQDAAREVNRGRWYDTEGKALNYSLQSGLFQGNLDMQKNKLRGMEIINEGNQIKNAMNLTRHETMRIMQAPTLNKLLEETLLTAAKRSLIPYQKDQLIAQAKNLDSSRALNEVRTLAQEKQNGIFNDAHTLLLNNIKVKEGQLSLMKANQELQETRNRWMSAGLSPTATQDLIEMISGKKILDGLGGKKKMSEAQQDREWMKRGRERFEEIRRANQNRK
jgi:hypothetical protein